MRYKQFFVQLILLAFVILIAFFISHRKKKGEYISLSGFAQGTTYHITYESKNGENYQCAVDSLLADIDMSLSIYQPSSVISRFNRNEPGTIADQKFIFVFNKSFEVFQKTSGAFDITVGPIVNALGFGSSDTLNVDSTLIEGLLTSVGMNKISLQHTRLIKQTPDMVLDVNAIAQGYSVDLVAEFLEARKIRNYMVEIGGEVRAKGKNSKNLVWRIGIDRPVEGNFLPGADLQAIIRLKNGWKGSKRPLPEKATIRKNFGSTGVQLQMVLSLQIL